jgi:hypothetical protein
LTIERDIRCKNNEAFFTKNNKLGDELSNIKPDTYEEYFYIGQKIKVKWSKDEIGNSGCKTGWYCAQVQEGHIEEDYITIVYYNRTRMCIYITRFRISRLREARIGLVMTALQVNYVKHSSFDFLTHLEFSLLAL